jgi:hypothetical protein
MVNRHGLCSNHYPTSLESMWIPSWLLENGVPGTHLLAIDAHQRRYARPEPAHEREALLLQKILNGHRARSVSASRQSPNPFKGRYKTSRVKK